MVTFRGLRCLLVWLGWWVSGGWFAGVWFLDWLGICCLRWVCVFWVCWLLCCLLVCLVWWFRWFGCFAVGLGLVIVVARGCIWRVVCLVGLVVLVVWYVVV